MQALIPILSSLLFLPMSSIAKSTRVERLVKPYFIPNVAFSTNTASCFVVNISRPNGVPTGKDTVEEVSLNIVPTEDGGSENCQEYWMEANRLTVELCADKEGQDEWVWPSVIDCLSAEGRMECSVVATMEDEKELRSKEEILNRDEGGRVREEQCKRTKTGGVILLGTHGDK